MSQVAAIVGESQDHDPEGKGEEHGKWECKRPTIVAKLIRTVYHMGGGYLASRDAHSEDRSRDEDGGR